MGPFSLGDWHEDRVCIYDDSTDTAVAWISEAQGRPLPGTLLMLIKAAPEMLALLRRGADAVGALEADCDEAGVNCCPARHWWQDVDKLIERIEGRGK